MTHAQAWTAVRIAMAAAAVVVIAAAFMPWVEADVSLLSVRLYSVTVDGMERDGEYTTVMAGAIIAAVLATVVLRLPDRHASTAVAVLGAGIALIGVLTWIDIEGAVDVDGDELEALPLVEARVQLGLILTTVAGLAAALLGLAGMRLAALPADA
jgi:hypothetical protein